VDTEQTWADDTVALGGREEPAPPEPGPPRPLRGRAALPSRRLVLSGAGAAVLIAGIAALLGGDSDSKPETRPAPIRAVADPAPSIPIEPPTHPGRREDQRAPAPALKRQPEGKLEQREREPTASRPAHELDTPPAPDPAPVPAVVEPAPAPELSPAPPAPARPPAPTPPAVEFGL